MIPELRRTGQRRCVVEEMHTGLGQGGGGGGEGGVGEEEASEEGVKFGNERRGLKDKSQEPRSGATTRPDCRFKLSELIHAGPHA